MRHLQDEKQREADEDTSFSFMGTDAGSNGGSNSNSSNSSNSNSTSSSGGGGGVSGSSNRSSGGNANVNTNANMNVNANVNGSGSNNSNNCKENRKDGGKESSSVLSEAESDVERESLLLKELWITERRWLYAEMKEKGIPLSKDEAAEADLFEEIEKEYLAETERRQREVEEKEKEMEKSKENEEKLKKEQELKDSKDDLRPPSPLNPSSLQPTASPLPSSSSTTTSSSSNATSASQQSALRALAQFQPANKVKGSLSLSLPSSPFASRSGMHLIRRVQPVLSEGGAAFLVDPLAMPHPSISSSSSSLSPTSNTTTSAQTMPPRPLSTWHSLLQFWPNYRGTLRDGQHAVKDGIIERRHIMEEREKEKEKKANK